MREIRQSGSEGGGFEFNRFPLPLSSARADPSQALTQAFKGATSPRVIAQPVYFRPNSPTDCCRLPLNRSIFVQKAGFMGVHFVDHHLFSYT